MQKFLMIILLLFSTSIFANSFNEIVFFGDSLSDDGNLIKKIKVLPKSPPYYKGRFSNGITWAEHLGNYYYNKSYVNYFNYAYGGATTILHSPANDPFIAPIILAAELDLYLVNSARKDKSHTLFGIWIGANDYLYEKTENIDELTDVVINKIVWSITTLINKGGQNFLILNLPDLGQTPFARANKSTDKLTAVSKAHNRKLFDAIRELKQKHPNVTFNFFNIYSLFVDLLKHPDYYNEKYHTHITDTMQGCWKGNILGRDKRDEVAQNLLTELNGLEIKEPEAISKMILSSPSLYTTFVAEQSYKKNNLTPCENANEYLFWDDLHPSAVVHEVLAQILIEALNANYNLS